MHCSPRVTARSSPTGELKGLFSLPDWQLNTVFHAPLGVTVRLSDSWALSGELIAGYNPLDNGVIFAGTIGIILH